jgi:hypothetical protein
MVQSRLSCIAVAAGCTHDGSRRLAREPVIWQLNRGQHRKHREQHGGHGTADTAIEHAQHSILASLLGGQRSRSGTIAISARGGRASYLLGRGGQIENVGGRGRSGTCF